jgi:phage repressor protein C with HTH and peptisase S24 domain
MHTDPRAAARQNVQMVSYRDAAVAYLRLVADKTGKPISELADLVGASHTTFTRPVNNPNYKYAPKFPKLQALSEKTGVPLSQDLVNSRDQAQESVRPLSTLPVRYMVAAGLWAEQDFVHDVPHGEVPMVEDRAYAGVEQWAELIKGESMNRHYRDGDYVHVVSTIALRYEAEPGDHVIVVRTDPGGRTERTCKVVDVVDGRRIVRGDSTNPIWNEPVDVEADPKSTVEILGLVIGSYRPRRR